MKNQDLNALFSALSSMEGHHALLTDVKNTLLLFEEQSRIHTDMLNSEKAWTADYVKSQCNIIYSLLSVAVFRLSSILNDLRADIDEGYTYFWQANKAQIADHQSNGEEIT